MIEWFVINILIYVFSKLKCESGRYAWSATLKMKIPKKMFKPKQQESHSDAFVAPMKMNLKYEASSSKPSSFWKYQEEYEAIFPFSKDQVMQHVQKTIHDINQDETKPERVFYSAVRGIYLYGSRTFKTNMNDSDFDFVFLADDLTSENSSEGGFSRNSQYMLHTTIRVQHENGETEYELEIMMMNTFVFLEMAFAEIPVILLSVQQPNEKFVLFEDDKMKIWRENWNKWFLRLPRSRNAILHELNFSYNKAYRFWLALQNGVHTTEKAQKDYLKKVKKNLAHGIR